jgi:NAD(P)H-dependent FMN reductase
LRTARYLTPPGVDAVLYGRLGALPHFNPDDETPPLPVEVEDLRSAIHAADALIFSAPEYAGALPGSFKNLLDWTIGDAEAGSIYGKAACWINASPREGRGAHDELRTVLGYAHATVVDAACIHVPTTPTMIGPDGLIPDPWTRDAIARALRVLADHVGCAPTLQQTGT